ncbi:hypothetical protein FNV43_RR10375 [Rhamnella rubrinervis]|uniref:Uncharacterized protein n=1 Tax=Rhamnella rubrinervis TaxID=2594499 RepID=A0A8K0MKP8_9ROSA|nr:hypothetical protein FNV43_RR10375 [Rhamnella rubrinervis]
MESICKSPLHPSSPSVLAKEFLEKTLGQNPDTKALKKLHSIVFVDRRLSGLHMNLYIGNGLVAMNGKCRRLEDGRQVFDEMPIRDEVHQNFQAFDENKIGLLPSKTTKLPSDQRSEPRGGFLDEDQVDFEPPNDGLRSSPYDQSLGWIGRSSCLLLSHWSASFRAETTKDVMHSTTESTTRSRVMRTHSEAKILPHWIPSLPNLSRLALMWSGLHVDPFESLQPLPNLVQIELIKAYDEEALSSNAGGIETLANLKVLEFVDMSDELLTRLRHRRHNDLLHVSTFEVLEILVAKMEHIHLFHVTLSFIQIK